MGGRDGAMGEWEGREQREGDDVREGWSGSEGREGRLRKGTSEERT